MALDQGTTSSRAIIFDKEGRICSVKQKEFTQHFPNNGWVEHDPMEIWATQMSVMMEARETMGIRTEDIAAIGITNQRETTIVWDRKTGNPVYHAIVWQCRRTADRIEQLKAEGYDKDNTPYESSFEFTDYSEGIETVAKSLVKYYLNPSGTKIYDGETAAGWYYNGPTLSGVNTRYATDQDWHKKVYSYMELLYNRL